jgi:tRNA-specific 2-thiouridylase
VKIGELARLADRLGAEKIATGHYARTGLSPAGDPCIREGVDRSKDQSYFLYALAREHIARLVFPLGESTKSEVRAEAVARRLPGATKGESQELCFVGAGAGAYASFVEARARDRLRPGPIVDAEGRVVGRHEGIHRFTIGQRKGLGVALGRPAFVASIDAASATVHLGADDDLASTHAAVDDVVLAPGVVAPFGARARVRYRHEGAPCRVAWSEEAPRGSEGSEPGERPRGASGSRRLSVAFDGPVRAVSRGQVVVFYDGDRVLGGGRIAGAERRSSPNATTRADLC